MAGYRSRANNVIASHQQLIDAHKQIQNARQAAKESLRQPWQALQQAKQQERDFRRSVSLAAQFPEVPNNQPGVGAANSGGLGLRFPEVPKEVPQQKAAFQRKPVSQHPVSQKPQQSDAPKRVHNKLLDLSPQQLKRVCEIAFNKQIHEDRRLLVEEGPSCRKLSLHQQQRKALIVQLKAVADSSKTTPELHREYDKLAVVLEQMTGRKILTEVQPQKATASKPQVARTHVAQPLPAKAPEPSKPGWTARFFQWRARQQVEPSQVPVFTPRSSR